jgi:hypothetical protein
MSLARFDASGIGAFDGSIGGCIRSFWAAAGSLPAFYLAMLFEGTLPAGGGSEAAFIAQTIGFVILCVAFPLASERILHWLGRDASWPLLVTGYNWLNFVQNWVWLVLVLVTHVAGLGAAIVTPLFLTFYVFCLAVEGFMFNAVLGGVLVAREILLVLLLLFIDFFFSEVVNVVARWIA